MQRVPSKNNHIRRHILWSWKRCCYVLKGSSYWPASIKRINTYGNADNTKIVLRTHFSWLGRINIGLWSNLPISEWWAHQRKNWCIYHKNHKNKTDWQVNFSHRIKKIGLNIHQASERRVRDCHTCPHRIMRFRDVFDKTLKGGPTPPLSAQRDMWLVKHTASFCSVNLIKCKAENPHTLRFFLSVSIFNLHWAQHVYTRNMNFEICLGWNTVFTVPEIKFISTKNVAVIPTL